MEATLILLGKTILNQLVVNIKLRNCDNNNEIEITAIWDTGSNYSNISQRAASQLKLQNHTREFLHTAGGTALRTTHFVDIILPNTLTIPNVKVYESTIDEMGIDMLIGMDIISLGDFAVTNYDGQTKYLFRYPSSNKPITFERE